MKIFVLGVGNIFMLLFILNLINYQTDDSFKITENEVFEKPSFNYTSWYNAISVAPANAEGTIVAKKGEGNFIIFRTVSGINSPGVIATIELNFTNEKSAYL